MPDIIQTTPPSVMTQQPTTQDQIQREAALAGVLLNLDALEAYTNGARVTHQGLQVNVPSTLSALPDAVTKVGLALDNLRDVLVQCRDIATRGNPVGYGLPVPAPQPYTSPTPETPRPPDPVQTLKEGEPPPPEDKE